MANGPFNIIDHGKKFYKYYIFTGLIFIIILTFWFYKQSNNMIDLIVTIHHTNDNKKLSGFLIKNYNSKNHSNHSYIFFKSLNGLIKNQLMIATYKNINYNIKIIGFIQGYYVGYLEKNIGPKIYYNKLYGYKGQNKYIKINDNNEITLINNMNKLSCKDKNYSVGIFSINNNKIHGLYNGKTFIPMKKIFQWLNLLHQKKFNGPSLESVVHYNVKTQNFYLKDTNYHNNYFINLNSWENKSLLTWQNFYDIIKKNIDKKFMVLNYNNKPINIKIIDGFIGSVYFYNNQPSQLLYKDNNVSYYYIDYCPWIIKFINNECYVLDGNKFWYKALNSKKVFKIITINHQPVKNYNDFSKLMTNKNIIIEGTLWQNNKNIKIYGNRKSKLGFLVKFFQYNNNNFNKPLNKKIL